MASGHTTFKKKKAPANDGRPGLEPALAVAHCGENTSVAIAAAAASPSPMFSGR